MEMTIDQLAQRVSMSSRNIREWQRQGLLPPPARRGRIGIYVEDHVTRIERVKKLHGEGFPLDLIRRMIDSDIGHETAVRQLADEVLTPFATAGPVTVSRAELDDRLGTGAAAHLRKLGLVGDADDDPVTVSDTETLTLIENVLQAGIPLGPLVDALVDVKAHQRAIAETILSTYTEEIWQPFVASNFATPGWDSLAESSSRARPLAIALLAHLQRSALDDVTASFVLREISPAEQALGNIIPPKP